jgi:pSer/pThr/pTyr-binding forkhead associated (FHA) protein
MSQPFDFYHIWLGIPPEEQPPNHYRLLGITLLESDREVIVIAAQRQMAHLKTFALGTRADISQQLLNELARAKLCLLDPRRKAKYDANLRARLAPRSGMAGPGGTPPADRPQSSGAASAHPPRTWVIGSAPECNLVVALPAVSRHHCRLTSATQGCFLEDLGSANGTFLNGRKITASILVCRSDTIRLGRSVPMPWPRETPPCSARLIRIGAGPDNDVVLDLPMISWRHAFIRLKDGRATLEDLGSTNGTAVGSRGNKIQRARLHPKDLVYLGSYRIPANELLAMARRSTEQK